MIMMDPRPLRSPSPVPASPPPPSPQPPVSTLPGISVPYDGRWRPPGQAVGWGAVENAVRDFDEQQVKDCKEDIDTLLTFAGLYSAALTALISLSYSQLQEDTVGESLKVLRQISDQTATYILYQNSILNTTASLPSPPPPFQPSATAINVNALWFSSLVCSLATASIGILVKQWLRAYMAFATSSTQGRLRVRHFRRSGLTIWKVFEIAAVLPVLIQIALGLFFVGLCYFTLDAEPNVGHATISLVAAWALFFFIVTVCPVFFAGCPYKTASIENGLTAMRPYIYRALALIQLVLCSLPVYLCVGLGMAFERESERLRIAADAAASWAVKRLDMLKRPVLPHNERDAVKSEGVDFDILASADALQSNDELLGTAILDAVKQSQPHWHTVITLVLRILANRLPGDGNLGSRPSLIDCRTLPRQGRTAVMNILSHIMVEQLNTGSWVPMSYDLHSEEETKAALWACCIILSLDEDPLPAQPLKILGKCLLMSTKMRTEVAKIVSQTPDPRLSAERLRLLLAAICHYVKDVSDAMLCLKDILDVYFEHAGLPTFALPSDIVHLPKDREGLVVGNWSEVLNSDSLNDTVAHLAEVLCRDLRRNTENIVQASLAAPQVSTNFKDGLHYAVQLYAVVVTSYDSIVAESNTALCGTVEAICATYSPFLVKTLLLALTYQPDRALVMSLSWANLHQSLGSHWEGLECLHAAVESFTNVAPTRASPELTMDRTVNLCYIVLDILLHDPSVLADPHFFRKWRSIVRYLTQSLRERTPRDYEPPKVQKTWIDLWLRRIHHMDTSKRYYTDGSNDAAYVIWRDSFKPEESAISDAFLSALIKLYPGRRAYWRVRRLQEMLPEEREVAASDDQYDQGNFEYGDFALEAEEDAVVASLAIQDVVLSTHCDTMTGMQEDDQGSVKSSISVRSWIPSSPPATPGPSSPITADGPEASHTIASPDATMNVAHAGIIELVDGHPMSMYQVGRADPLGQPGDGGRVVMIRYNVQEGSVAVYRG